MPAQQLQTRTLVRTSLHALVHIIYYHTSSHLSKVHKNMSMYTLLFWLDTTHLSDSRRVASLDQNNFSCDSAGSETSGSRERCDSLPCAPRLRTTSEGYVPASSAPHHHSRLLGHLSGTRPASMYAKPSPPIDCSPVSPTSAGCSTDSAGSSLSIDEIDSSLPWPSEHLRHHVRNKQIDRTTFYFQIGCTDMCIIDFFSIVF